MNCLRLESAGTVIAERTMKAFRSKTTTRPIHNKSDFDIYRDRAEFLKFRESNDE